MELVPAGVPLSFSAIFDDTGLHAAMSVYDDSGASPVLLLSPFAMASVVGNTYRGKFTAAAGKSYIVFMAVYTDGTFATLDPSYPEQSQTVLAEYLNGAFSCPVTGFVDGGEMVAGQNTFVVFTGDDKTMFMKAATLGCDAGPLDLTECTEIDVALPNADGTFTHRLLSTSAVSILQPPVLGKFSVTIPSSLSALLNPGPLQNVNVTFTIAGAKLTVPFVQGLSVFEN